MRLVSKQLSRSDRLDDMPKVQHGKQQLANRPSKNIAQDHRVIAANAPYLPASGNRTMQLA